MDWEIFGHDWAVALLKAQVGNGTLRHAYLLIGVQGVGRRTLAIRFAQAVNCTSPPEPGGFCNTCRDCRQIRAMAHPDLSLLAPQEGHREILIDQVRELQHTLSLAPYASRYRVALLPDFHRATHQAANALLKTIEEPADRVILLLTAPSQESLLPTIVSRCETIRLRPAAVDAARQYLVSTMGLEGGQAELVAHLSGGRIGAAIQLIDHPDRLTHRKKILEDLLEMLPASFYERFKLAAELTRSYGQSRQTVGDVLPIWLSFWRDVFIRSSGAELPLVNIDLEAQVSQLSALIHHQRARSLVAAHEEAVRHMDVNVNVRLLVETLMLEWPRVSPPEFQPLQ